MEQYAAGLTHKKDTKMQIKVLKLLLFYDEDNLTKHVGGIAHNLTYLQNKYKSYENDYNKTATTYHFIRTRIQFTFLRTLTQLRTFHSHATYAF